MNSKKTEQLKVSDKIHSIRLNGRLIEMPDGANVVSIKPLGMGEYSVLMDYPAIGRRKLTCTIHTVWYMS